MTVPLIILAWIAITALCAYAMCLGQAAAFGHVTRGDLVFFTVIAAITPAGVIAATMALSTPKMRTRWSKFWNKDVM